MRALHRHVVHQLARRSLCAIALFSAPQEMPRAVRRKYSRGIWCRARFWYCSVALVSSAVVRGETEEKTQLFDNGWSVDDLPSPTIDPVGCKRRNELRDGSFVCNPDGLLTSLGALRVDDQLEAISRLLSPCGDGVPQGIEGAVAVISRMLPSSGATSGPHHRLQLTVEDFAQHVHDDWRVGKQQCDNGFLLFASKEDRQFAISMGRGLEPYLTPKDRRAALNMMKPYLRRDDWDTAVSVALEELAKRLQKSLTREAETDETMPAVGIFRGGPSKLDGDRKWWEWWGFGRDGDGDGRGGGGGGIADMMGNMVGPQDASSLLIVPLVWGVLEGISAVNKRRANGFEAKLQRINAQRMAPSDTMDTPGRPYQPHKFNDCPICLEGFSHGFGVVGADGLPAAVMHCGHAFCQSCIARWRKQSNHNNRRVKNLGGVHPGLGMLCPVCDDSPPRPGDSRFGRSLRRTRLPSHPRGTKGICFFGSARRGALGTNSRRFESPPAHGGGPGTSVGASTWDGWGGMHHAHFFASVPTQTPAQPPKESSPPVVSGGDAYENLAPVEPSNNAPATSRQAGPWPSLDVGRGAAELARRDRAFRLASLRVQYPKLTKQHASLIGDYPSEVIRSRLKSQERRKASGWTSSSQRGDDFEDRRCFGGGRSSTATGGGW